MVFARFSLVIKFRKLAGTEEGPHLWPKRLPFLTPFFIFFYLFYLLKHDSGFIYLEHVFSINYF